MAETDVHRQNMIDLIQVLQDRYADDPDVYVTGNLLLFYEEGDRRKHIAPDVFMVRGVAKLPPRENYLVWEVGKGPDVVIELTSKTTRREDRDKKLKLYRDVLKVREYFVFDPNADWLDPPVQGYRLTDAGYAPIAPIAAHYLPSEVLGLHLVRDGFELRLYEPTTGRKLLNRRERIDEAESARRHAEAARQEVALMLQLAEARDHEAEARLREAEARLQLAEARLELAEARQKLAEARQKLAESEVAELRQEVEDLKRRLSGPS